MGRITFSALLLGGLCPLGHGSFRMVSELLAPGVRTAVHPSVGAAPVISSGSNELDLSDVRWLYPTTLTDEGRLVPVRSTKPLTERGEIWTDWFRGLNANPPHEVPSWAPLALQSGSIFGQLSHIGDTLWVTYSKEETFALQQLGLATGISFENGRAFGAIRLLPAALELTFFATSDEKVQQRSCVLPALSSIESDPTAQAWLSSIESLRQTNFWESLKDEARMQRLFEPDSDLRLSQIAETRQAVAEEYASWQGKLSALLGPNGVAGLSPVEALRLVELAPKAPWSLKPEILKTQSATLIRVSRKFWNAELNWSTALSIPKQPEVLSPGVRGSIAQILAESDSIDRFTEPVLALEGIARGYTSQQQSASVIRVLAMYNSRLGKHSAHPLLGEPGLLNTLMLSGVTAKGVDGQLVAGPAVCVRHVPSTLQFVEIQRSESCKLAFIGGNDKYQFTYRSSPGSPRAFGTTLAEILWKGQGVDNFDELSELPVSAGTMTQLSLDLHFPSGVASASIVEAPYSLTTRRLGTLPVDVLAEAKRAFEREVDRLKREPASVP